MNNTNRSLLSSKCNTDSLLTLLLEKQLENSAFLDGFSYAALNNRVTTQTAKAQQWTLYIEVKAQTGMQSANQLHYNWVKPKIKH